MAVCLNPPGQLNDVAGVVLASYSAGIRYAGRDDITLLVLAEGSSVVGVFTQNRYCAAPVVVAKQHLSSADTRALLINAGNANAGTGKQGLIDAQQSCAAVAGLLGLEDSQVLPFSTGVIGELMPMESVLSSLAPMISDLRSDNWLNSAKAIMTTDTVAKAVSEQVVIDGETITITGIAKGSGMICPNMATMLAYVATDADIDKRLLQNMLERASDASFNRITVDSDTSTNDAFILMASGQSELARMDDADSPQAITFYAALERISVALATSIIRDGEGATKFVTINVLGAENSQDARSIAYSVAHSPLVKTALFASDPNWGRLLAAIGKAEVRELDLDRVNLRINDLELIVAGEPVRTYTEEQGKTEFQKSEIEITIDLNLGQQQFHVWTTDLSHDYVSINADYRS